MTLSNPINKVSYTLSGAQTVFPFNVAFFDFTDITVTVLVNGATTEDPLSYNASPLNNTQFKIDATNGDTAQGANITIGGAGYSALDKVTIERVVPITQQYDLQEGSTIDPTALNKALDRAVAQNQQQQDELNNNISFPNTDTGINYSISESPTNRANKVIGFDGSGNINTQSLLASGTVTGGNGIDITGNQISVDGQAADFDFHAGELRIKSDAVTYDKMQDTSTDNRLLGAATAGTIGEVQVATNMIADDAVTVAKIADNAVTAAQIADNAVTSSEINANAVSLAKMAQIAKGSVIGRTSAGTGNPEHVAIGNFEEFYVLNGGTTALAKTNGGTYSYTLTDFTSASAGFDNTKIKSILIRFKGTNNGGSAQTGSIVLKTLTASGTQTSYEVVGVSPVGGFNTNTINMPISSDVTSIQMVQTHNGGSPVLLSDIIGATTFG
jgi:hypothetical protein